MRKVALFISFLFLGLTYGQNTQLELVQADKNWQEGKYEEAITIYLKYGAEEVLTAEQEFKLGMAYDLGKGVEKDNHKSVMWFEESAKKGYVPAMSAAAAMYLGYLVTDASGNKRYVNDPEKAYYWYQKACESGDKTACKRIKKKKKSNK